MIANWLLCVLAECAGTITHNSVYAIYIVHNVIIKWEVIVLSGISSISCNTIWEREWYLGNVVAITKEYHRGLHNNHLYSMVNPVKTLNYVILKGYKC